MGSTLGLNFRKRPKRCSSGSTWASARPCLLRSALLLTIFAIFLGLMLGSVETAQARELAEGRELVETRVGSKSKVKAPLPFGGQDPKLWAEAQLAALLFEVSSNYYLAGISAWHSSACLKLPNLGEVNSQLYLMAKSHLLDLPPPV